MEQRYRQLQRATVARSALDVIALIFLFAGFAFWGVAFWQLLGPPALLSLLSIQAVVLALVFSLAAPLLLSMLIPTTPAGQLLQKTQWRTIGFPVIIACAFYLTYQAETMIETWLYNQPGVQELGNYRALAISLTIAFVVIPALAWIQLTPERWLQQIQQAHAVKKLEMQQRGELAIIKASLLRSERMAIKGWANLLPLEKEEVFHTVRGLLMATSDTQRDIVRTLGLSADLERDIMNDAELADQLDYVKQSIDVLPDIAPMARDPETPALSAPADRAAGAPQSQERALTPYTEPHNNRVGADHPGSSGMISYEREYTIAHQRFGAEAWTVKDLATVLAIEPETAGKRKRAWEDERLVSGRGLSNGRYQFV